MVLTSTLSEDVTLKRFAFGTAPRQRHLYTHILMLHLLCSIYSINHISSNNNSICRSNTKWDEILKKACGRRANRYLISEKYLTLICTPYTYKPNTRLQEIESWILKHNGEIKNTTWYFFVKIL